MASSVPSPSALKEDPPLAPFVAVTNLSSGDLGAATSLAPSQVDSPSLFPAVISSVIPSVRVLPLALGVSGPRCGLAIS